MKSFLPIGLSALALLTACGPSPSANWSTESVSIPQSPIENQLNIGFCWSYAISALIESDVEVRTSKQVNLSEEALGFYRIAEELFAAGTYLKGEELAKYVSESSLQGWFLRDDDPNSPLPDTFELLERYGAVPESAWKVKFDTPDKTQRVVATIKQNFFELISKHKSDIITREDVIKAMISPNAFPSRPPTSFEVDGQKVTANDYLMSTLGFQPKKYVAVSAKDGADYPRLINVAKRAMARGISVPLAYPVNLDRLDGDTFSGKGVDLTKGENFFKDGGHAVLLTDFVNKGGKEGALPAEELKVELAKPADELDYFVFKNSWGTEAKTNESGKVVRGSKTGYYKIDLEYIKGSANLSQKMPGAIMVVVPQDLVQE